MINSLGFADIYRKFIYGGAEPDIITFSALRKLRAALT